MPFVATWMNLEITILKEVSMVTFTNSERQISYDITYYIWNLKKKDTYELICRTETDSQIWKNLWLPKGMGVERDGMGIWDWHMHAKVYGMTSQGGLAV